MKTRILITLILLTQIPMQVPAQDDVSLFNYWEYYSDVENSLYKHYCTIASEQLENRQAAIGELKTEEDWLKRQSLVRDQLMDIIGPFPDKTPLNVQVTGKLKKDDYTIEKIIYESIPGYHVTGALYIPDGIRKKAPAIFYACGHSVEGFRVAIYQHIIINLVKKGFVVFTIDPMGQGERFEYWDKQTGGPRFPVPDHEHSYAGAQCLISGYATARYFIWDVVRGIDYMLTRREIDPQRIGITGRSGGGNISAYVGAIDDRVYAAAPECYITSYEHIYKSIGPQCAEQNLYQMVWKGLDHADFIEVRAPKPTMIIGTTRDIFSIQGFMESFEEAKKMYVALDADERLMMSVDDTVHSSTPKNREAMYAFFQRFLENPGDPEDLDIEVPDPEELRVTKTGQLVTSLDGKSIFSLNSEIVHNQLEALEAQRSDRMEYLRKIPDLAARHAGITCSDTSVKSIFSGRYVKDGYTLEKYLVQGSGKYFLPAILLKPGNNPGDKIVLMFHTGGIDEAINQDRLAHDLVKEGYAVLSADLPGLGSMGPGYLKGDSYIDGVSYNQWFSAILVGRSCVGLRAEDILNVVHFVKDQLQEFSDITVLAVGPLGSEVLHAAVFEPAIKRIGLMNSFLSYAEIALTRFYKPQFIPFTVAGAIEDYDLPDLMASLCPRKVFIVNPVSGDGTAATEAQVGESLRFPEEVYMANNVQQNFKVADNVDQQSILKRLLSWLRY